MADRRYTLVFYAAVLTAAGATFGVYRTLQAAKDRARIETQPIVLASTDMPEGVALTRAELQVAQWPVGTVPAGAFSSVDSILGRVTRVPVFKGEAIVPGRLAPDGTGPGLEVKISPGKRAMALRVNDVSALSGMIQPNSRVDVMVTLNDADSTRKQVAKLFMENMRVLSVGTQVQRDQNGKPISAGTVSLEVTPDQAEELAIAANAGQIQLVLRGFGDPDSITTTGAVASDVLAKLRETPAPRPAPRRPAPRRTVARPPTPPPAPAPVVQAPPPPPKPDTAVVQVWRGDQRSAVKFEKKDSTRTPIPPR